MEGGSTTRKLQITAASNDVSKPALMHRNEFFGSNKERDTCAFWWYDFRTRAKNYSRLQDHLGFSRCKSNAQPRSKLDERGFEKLCNRVRRRTTFISCGESRAGYSTKHFWKVE